MQVRVVIGILFNAATQRKTLLQILKVPVVINVRVDQLVLDRQSEFIDLQAVALCNHLSQVAQGLENADVHLV